MSLDLGEVVGRIRLDSSGVGKGMQDAEKAVTGSIRKMERVGAEGGKSVGSKLGAELKRGFSVEGAVATFAKVFAASKIIEGMHAAADAASDLNETMNKSGVIFGSAMGQMSSWGDTAAESMGLSKQAALEAASSFGDMFLQLQFGQDQAAGMSREIVQMAADFGSFNNLGTEDVLERIAAGFRGEYDSLQKLIPNISAARVEQEAMALSGVKNAAGLTAQQKAEAVLVILRKDGARAMGDFAKTSSEYANATKIAAAKSEELAAKVGGYLLPIFKALTTLGVNVLIPMLSGVVDGLGAAGAIVGQVISAFRGLPAPLQAAAVALLAIILLKDRFAVFGGAIKTGLGGAVSSVHGTIDTLRLKMMYAADTAAASGGKFRALGSVLGGAAGGGLKGAASGLIGLLGGPWGIAFTAATAVVGAFIQHQQNARQSAEEFGATLDQQTGKLTENSTEWVKNRLAREVDPSDLIALRELGLNLDEVTAAVAGGAATWEAYKGKFDAFQASVEGSSSSTDQQIAAVRGLGNAIGYTTAETEAARAKQAALHPETKKVGEAAKTAAAGTGELTAAQKALQDKAKGAADELRDVLKVANELAGQFLDSRAATREYESALDAATKALEDNGRTLDVNSEKGRKNQAALDDIAKSALDMTKANLTAGQGIEQVTAQVDKARAQFIAMAVKMGMSTAAANALADQSGLTRTQVSNLSAEIGKVPTRHDTQVNVATAQANAAIAHTATLLSGLHNRTVIVGVQAKVDDTLRRLGVTQADGGILRDGVQTFAGGGMRLPSAATIAPDGANLVQWAERGTGGEAFIPLAPAKRARSVAIWEETGRRLGVAPASQSDGGDRVVKLDAKTLSTLVALARRPVEVGVALTDRDAAAITARGQKTLRKSGIGGA